MLKMLICSNNPEYTLRGIEAACRELYNVYGIKRIDTTHAGIYCEIEHDMWYKVKDICMNEHFVFGWEIDGDTLIVE